MSHKTATWVPGLPALHFPAVAAVLGRDFTIYSRGSALPLGLPFGICPWTPRRVKLKVREVSFTFLPGAGAERERAALAPRAQAREESQPTSLGWG